mmetsp:Transcript_57334/g.83821  ORF Transcript_57334/g.83821 Transcript_57334/m.83821 type:complete len:83 (-) Transcript_57334:53-301(-)
MADDAALGGMGERAAAGAGCCGAVPRAAAAEDTVPLVVVRGGADAPTLGHIQSAASWWRCHGLVVDKRNVLFLASLLTRTIF